MSPSPHERRQQKHASVPGRGDHPPIRRPPLRRSMSTYSQARIEWYAPDDYEKEEAAIENTNDQ